MIDEPLAFLAEAFGQEPEPLISSLAESEAADDAAMAFVIAAAVVGQTESAAFAARSLLGIGR